MKSVIALDIGGVCIQLFPEKILNFAGWSRFPSEMVAWEAKMECGKLDWKNWCLHCRQYLPSRLRAYSDQELQRVFCSMIGKDMPGIADLCRRWKLEGRTLVLFSNTSEIHAREVWKNMSFRDCIGGAVYSYEVGRMKPHPDMYRAFEEQYGVPDLYLDDRQENVDGARLRGWNAWRFQGTDLLDEKKLLRK